MGSGAEKQSTRHLSLGGILPFGNQAGFLAHGSLYLPRLPEDLSGIVRRSSPFTVAGQRGSQTPFPIITRSAEAERCTWLRIFSYGSLCNSAQGQSQMDCDIISGSIAPHTSSIPSRESAEKNRKSDSCT